MGYAGDEIVGLMFRGERTEQSRFFYGSYPMVRAARSSSETVCTGRCELELSADMRRL